MSVNIVVATCPGREGWLLDLLVSLGRDCLVLSDDTYELGKIKWVYENTKWERFWLLHDSIVIKDSSFIDRGWDIGGSVGFCNCPGNMGMYIGVYSRSELDRLGIPEAMSKRDAVKYETEWLSRFDCHTLCNDFWDSDKFEERHGRVNMVLENRYIIKYKATWGM